MRKAFVLLTTIIILASCSDESAEKPTIEKPTAEKSIYLLNFKSSTSYTALPNGTVTSHFSILSERMKKWFTQKGNLVTLADYKSLGEIKINKGASKQSVLQEIGGQVEEAANIEFTRVINTMSPNEMLLLISKNATMTLILMPTKESHIYNVSASLVIRQANSQK